MKNISIVILTLFFSLKSNSQIVVQIGISNPKWEGYGVSMYYVMRPDVCDSLLLIDSFSEWQILRHWGLPIMTNGNSDIGCMEADTITLKLPEVFDVRQSIELNFRYGDFDVEVNFYKVERLKYCNTDLTGNYWSYHVSFFEAVLLTEKPTFGRWGKYDLKLIKRIEKILRKVK